MHLDEPVDENGAHLLRDIILRGHVVDGRREVHFFLLQVGVDLLDILGHGEFVESVSKIDVLGTDNVGGSDVVAGSSSQ